MNNQIQEHLLDFVIPVCRKSFDQVLKPNLCMVLDILPDHLIQVFTDNKPFVADAADNAWNQHDVVLLLFAIFRVKYHFHYFFGNTEQLDAIIDQAFFKKWSKLLNLV